MSAWFNIAGSQPSPAHGVQQDPHLTEEEPTAAERPFVRAGWFRGPREAVVFVYRASAWMEMGLPPGKHGKNMGKTWEKLGKITILSR